MAGNESNGIDHLFRAEAARLRGSKIDFVVLIPFVLFERQLIRARCADGANQLLRIEAALEIILSERIEQWRVARRVAGANVIHWIDNPAAKEIAPGAIGH